MSAIDTYFIQEVQWLHTENAEYPYQVEIDNKTWIIRINDFPEEELYTLIIDDVEIKHFSTWPPTWEK